MGDFYTQKKDGINFKQICLGHYKRIFEISTSEFTGGYWNYLHTGNVTNKQYVTDKRKEFIQAIEILALALSPHFDEDMKEAYITYEKESKGFEDKDDTETSRKHLKVIKILFKDLSHLMHRINYFDKSVYVEDESGFVDTD